MPNQSVRAVLLGLAVGDALGLPAEYRPRRELDRFPAAGMSGGGTWGRGSGVWGDDAALSFCLAETIASGYDLRALADRCVAWLDSGYWSAEGRPLGVGRSVEFALGRLRSGVEHPTRAGLRRETDNGNGALMRILPAAFLVRGKTADERSWTLAEIASLTHAHRRSQLSCIFLVEYAIGLLNGRSPLDAYRVAVMEFSARFMSEPELPNFSRILSGRLPQLSRRDVPSSGYVLDSLEAALWSVLTTDSFQAAALAAVNLGGDADTVCSIACGLAGIVYGESSIPPDWLAVLARRGDIEALADRMEAALRLPTSIFAA